MRPPVVDPAAPRPSSRRRAQSRRRQQAKTASASAAPRAGRHGIDEEQFARDLSLMLRSGLSVMEALNTSRERSSGSAARSVDHLITRLQQGDSLSQALTLGGHFSPALLACVKASELSGDLGESLERFAANAMRMRLMRGKLISALVYPMLLVGVAFLVVVFLLVYVVPRFAMVLESAQQELPAMSRLLIALGHVLNGVPASVWASLGGLFLLGVWQVWRLVRSGRLAAVAVAAAARLPWLRGLVRAFGLGQMTRSAAMLTRSGIPALRALAMCRDLLTPPDRPGLDQALAQASAGAPLAGALHAEGLLDNLGLRVLRVAEQTGALDLALDRLADIHENQLERQLERAGRLIEPIVMLGIGVVVGGIVVLMYLPIFQLASSIQ
jgi:general secretion pathway protein F